MNDMPFCKLVTKTDAALDFGVSVKSIDNYIERGLIPAPVPFASKEYWHPDDFKLILNRLFKRCRPAEEATPNTNEISAQPKASPKTDPKTKRDSNPAVRPRNRQRGRLDELNNGTTMSSQLLINKGNTVKGLGHGHNCLGLWRPCPRSSSFGIPKLPGSHAASVRNSAIFSATYRYSLFIRPDNF